MTILKAQRKYSNNFKMLKENYFQPRIRPICRVLIKCGTETRYFQIYKAAKMLPLKKKKKLLLMHTFSESPRKMCFIKIKERKIGKHGIQKKGDTTQNRIPNPPKWEKMQDQTLAISI